MIIFVTGQPCSGKTEVARRIADSIFGSLHISSGDVARSLAETEPDVREALSKNQYVPEEFFDDLMLRELASVVGQRILVVDGYPRYWSQWCDIQFLPAHPKVMLTLHVSGTNLRERAKVRGRDDDDHFETRLTVYNERTAPMVRHLVRRNLMIRVDNNKPTIDWAVKECMRSLNEIIGWPDIRSPNLLPPRY